jgi:D-alanyl-D-alanine carboxypeptidase/D-alanyl-D-alanine-endopeptidase (penicillin-binding protein 4)
MKAIAMRKQIPLLMLLIPSLLLVVTIEIFAQRKKTASKQTPKPCAAQIEAVLKDTIFNRAFVGIHIVSLKSGKTIFQQNKNKLFRPASNLKLFTSAASLAVLGNNFQITTELYADSPADSVIRGSVYLKGYGDPLLTTVHLDSLARDIYKSGVREILGDIVGDVSCFDDVFWGKGWMWDDDPGYLWPFLSPLSLNGNSIAVTTSPGLKEGDSVTVSLDPPTRYVTVINNSITSSDTTNRSLKINRQWKERQNVIILEGALHPHASSTTTRFNVWRPELYTLEVFKERLLANGIRVRGVSRVGRVNKGGPIAVISHTLDSVLILMNKDSYNLGAESLLKILAAERRGVPGSADSGIVVMKEYLATIGLDTAAMIIADGSGVSRYNLVSPYALVKLLTTICRDSSLFALFWNSLAIGGVDGTLKTRLTGKAVRGNVHAKSGSHSDVLALSGYVITTRKDTLAFSMMINHFPKDAELHRKAQDRIVEILTNCR